MNDSTTGYAGVDWAIDAHAVCVVDGEGRVIVEFDVAHSADGLRELCEVRRSRPCRLAIGLSAPERRSVSDRQTRPEPPGAS